MPPSNNEALANSVSERRRSRYRVRLASRMNSQSACSLISPLTAGGIEDVGLGLSWDAATFRDEVNRRVATLSQMGIGRGSVVAIGHGGTARFFADLFATWNVGAAAACLDPSLTPGELRTVVDFAKSAVLLVDGAASVDRLPVPIVDLSNDYPRGFSGDATPIDPDDPALVLFTSGTTGAPKGVVLSFRALQTRINANIAAIGTAALARALVSLPTHFGHGLIGNSLTPLLAGGNIVLHPLGIPMANDLGRIIDEHGITFMSSVPTLWRMALTRSIRPAGGSLMRVHVGSAPFPAVLWSEVVAWSGAEVVNCYGTTETANWIAGASSRTDGIADGLVGRMWGGSAAVMDESGAIRQTGAGEIIIRSPSLMSGYLDRPDLTRAALHQGWYRTGDQGSIDQEGRLRLTGRIKDEINRAGFKVQPAEIDALLESNPAVAEACVFGVSDPLGGEAVAAAIRLENGVSVSPQSLQAWCLERVRREAVPERWFIVSEIPRTSRGKVSRDVVRRMLVEQPGADARRYDLATPAPGGDETDLGTTASTVRNAVELAWTEVLGRDSYVADIPLNQTGGDSLDAMRMWLLIEKTIGAQLLMDVLESDPTPSQLTTALKQQLRATPVSPSQSVFLMIPAEGDSPSLAHFRALLKDRIHFVMIKYPGWREMIDAGAGFEAIVDAAVAQICRQSGQDVPCLLAGYSFGGLVAVETGRRLVEHGRRIDFLGLIDTRAERPPEETRQARSVSRPMKFIGKIFSALILISAFRPLKIMGQLATLLPAKQAFTIEFMLNTRLRTRSLRRLQLNPLQAPITLYRSDEGSSLDNGWSVHCSQVTVVPTGGDHHSILEPPFLDILCTRFLEAVEPFDSDRQKDTSGAPRLNSRY
jgi:acyl-CoA synthetase (AMP-forming)/AMP-acid ligase II/thioesterase domain-containing protein